jgi:small subunit ribosomal protein S18
MPKKKKKSFKKLQKNTAPKECWFCTEKKQPSFSDKSNLSRFTTERGKIIARSRSGLCGKHQKALTIEVKRARHLALLPFIVQV